MATLNTPNDIEVLLHFCCCASEHPRHYAPAVAETIERYLKDEILKPKNNTQNNYELTDKGYAWLNCILNTEYPNKVWVDKLGNIIESN